MPSYTRTTWQDYPNVTTPITASRLNNMETGIVGANSIIVTCTAATRPSSPFNGQRIYETDTRRSWTYVNSAWVPDDMVFTNEAARNAAIPLPYEGQSAYLTAPTVPAATGGTTAVPTGVTTIYNGSVWVCVTPVGAYTSNAGATTSTSYTTSLTGSPGTNPSVTLVTGTTALVSVSTMANNSGAGSSVLGVRVSGATSPQQDFEQQVGMYISATLYFMFGRTAVITGLTAGTNTFTLIYRVGSNTGNYEARQITVQGIA